MSQYRIEHDSMGELKVPADALYGAQTQRAVDNFPISGLRLPRAFIRALGLIKAAAAEANLSLGHLRKGQAAAIRKAALVVANKIALGQIEVGIAGGADTTSDAPTGTRAEPKPSDTTHDTSNSAPRATSNKA